MLGRAGVVSRTPPDFRESQVFVKTPSCAVRFPHFQEHSSAVGLPCLREESSYQLLPDSPPSSRRRNNDVLEFPFRRQVARHQKAQDDRVPISLCHERQPIRGLSMNNEEVSILLLSPVSHGGALAFHRDQGWNVVHIGAPDGSSMVFQGRFGSGNSGTGNGFCEYLRIRAPHVVRFQLFRSHCLASCELLPSDGGEFEASRASEIPANAAPV